MTARTTLRVLVVEDDREIRGLLQSVLALEGFEVRSAVSLSEARALLEHQRPDLVILDLGLPDGDGGTLEAACRGRQRLPVIVVSARQDEAQKVALLDAGADDYLVKPFGVGELLARIRVALRHRGTALEAAQTRYALEGVLIDLETRSVELEGRPVRVTPIEFRLLALLVRSAGRVVTQRRLLTEVWGADYTGHTHYLRIHMGNLRAKLERDPTEPRVLLTEPGVGYRLAAD